MEYMVIIEKAEDGYYTYSPELWGCTSFGKTTEKALDNMKEAITENIPLLKESGQPLPKPHISYITKVAI